MNVSVNLLPGEIEQRNLARRQRSVGIGAVAALVAVLAGAYGFQANQIGAAEQELAAEEQTLAALQAEVTELAEYQELALQADTAAQVLAAALGGETSMAGALQDLAAVMPANAELESLNVTSAVPDEPTAADGAPASGVGTLIATGRTLDGHAPGLERLLLELHKISSFGDVFFTQAETDEDGAVAFTVEVDLEPDLRTNRYLDGLPEELQ